MMQKTAKPPVICSGLRVPLKDGASTAVHILRFNRHTHRPKLVIMDYPTRLAEWCQNNSVDFAIGGGFTYLYAQLMGEYWQQGVQLKSSMFPPPWWGIRGSAHFGPDGSIGIDHRKHLPKTPDGDLIQAGPLLVKEGSSLIAEGEDPEDFTSMDQLFEPNPAIGRHPRTAIGCNDRYFWAVVCDGRSQDNAGMTWSELADFMISLGAKDALNLDGGSGSTMVAYGQMINTSVGAERLWPEGRHLKSAIVFEAH